MCPVFSRAPSLRHAKRLRACDSEKIDFERSVEIGCRWERKRDAAVAYAIIATTAASMACVVPRFLATLTDAVFSAAAAVVLSHEHVSKFGP